MAEKKKVNKKLLKFSIILYILIIVLVAGYSLAWFISNRSVEISVNEEIIINSGTNLEIARMNDDGTLSENAWGHRIELSLDKSATYPDVTGNGLKFYYPIYLTSEDQPNVEDADSYRELNEQISSSYLITLRLKIRSSDHADVYLSQDSYVKPKDKNNADSIIGSFANDYIAGCARVAFLEVVDGQEILKNVWIPNDKYHLSYDEDGKAEFTETGERESEYGYHIVNDGEVQQIKYNAEEDYVTGKVLVGNQNLATQANETTIPPMVNGATPIVEFNESTGMDEKEIIIRIWFEGTDREADKALNGGDVLYNFQFVAIDKDNAAPTSYEKLKTLIWNTDNKLYYEGDAEAAKDFLYSFNGIDWANYNQTNLTGATVVYVKTEETSRVKSSAAYKIEKP